MNLKPRFLLLTTIVILVSGIAVWSSVRQLAEEIIDQWAVRYAEKQVLYDRSRVLQPVLREIALSRQFASSDHIINWARQPDNPALTDQAILEMEQFRLNFTDKSYFVALRDSGHYYHNNARNEYAGRQLRYTLDPEKTADRWFYDIISQQRDLHLNVNPDVELGVTKLWIDVLLRDGNEILGVLGTGLELNTFINTVVNDSDASVSSLFVDHQGAVQLYRDQSMIDYASISSTNPSQHSLNKLFTDPADQQAIREAMTEVGASDNLVATRFVHLDGKRCLAGVAYVPEIDWYEITLIDIEALLPLSSFSSILLVYGITLLMAMLLFNLALERIILRPLYQLEQAMQGVANDDFSEQSLPHSGRGEIGRLITHFRQMALSVLESRRDLEQKVQERTEALEQLSKTDALTGLLNRRGMTERIEAEIMRSQRESNTCGIIWLDLDHFKDINDRHGHTTGDNALVHIAQLIRTQIRPYDSAARWGGDEFLILLQNCTLPLLESLSQRLSSAAAECAITDTPNIRPTVSAGAYLATPQDDLETLLHRSDLALYEAKNAGRNCVRIYKTEKAAAT